MSYYYFVFWSPDLCVHLDIWNLAHFSNFQPNPGPQSLGIREAFEKMEFFFIADFKMYTCFQHIKMKGKISNAKNKVTVSIAI